MTHVMAYIGLGANLGDRSRTMAQGVNQLASTPGMALQALSAIYESAPEGGVEQPPYLNAVAAIETTIGPSELLELLLRIELGLGRDRTMAAPASPRTIDLDMLLYGDLVCTAPGLEIPHPRMLRRGFVMAPLSEIAPAAVHPGVNSRIDSLLLELGSAALPSLARAEFSSDWPGPIRKDQ